MHATLLALHKIVNSIIVQDLVNPQGSISVTEQQVLIKTTRKATKSLANLQINKREHNSNQI